MEIDKEYVLEAINGDNNALAAAFSWSDTPQGHDYWRNQYSGAAPIDVDTLLAMIGEPVKKMEVGTLSNLDVKPGDVVECLTPDVWGVHYTPGRKYEVGRKDDDCVSIKNDEGVQFGTFRLISRAPVTPKTWGDMTDAEKGALLLAAHEGKVIEWHAPDIDHTGRTASMSWVECQSIGRYSDYTYRIKPEPKRETVTITGWCDEDVGWLWGKGPDDQDTHRITFDTIDCDPDCDSIKMDRL